jgi:RND family efflux transporter MFP subunit
MRWIRVVPFAACLFIGGGVGYLAKTSTASKPARRVLYYQDPMHPSYKSSKPGTSPDCGMDLVPVYADGLADAVSAEVETTGAIIDPAIQQLYGIRVVTAELNGGKAELHLFGRIEPDDTRTYKLEFGTDGYVKETHGDAVGTHVLKDQRLATVYSPDFLAVAGGYLAANEHAPSPSGGNASTVQNAASAFARADRLRNLGMSDSQIEEISRTRKLPEDVYVVSPTDGFVLSRSVSAGMRFERHNELYTISDLSRVWIVAEAFGREAQAVRPGTGARIYLPDSGETVLAVVKSVLPDVDPITKAIKIRLEAANPGFKLRPGMSVNVDLPVTIPHVITIPVDAIIDSGSTKRVFVRTKESDFVPRIVNTGLQVGDRVQVLNGLDPGESVASSGTFLIDSEARLHSVGNSTRTGDRSQ